MHTQERTYKLLHIGLHAYTKFCMIILTNTCT